MCCLGNAVLLEGTVDGVAGEESLRAEWFIGCLAEVALQARAIDPLDTGVVSAMDCVSFCSTRSACTMLLQLPVLDETAHSNDNTSTLVSTDEWKFGGEWPVTIHGVQVGVADAGVLDVHEDLIWTWFLYWNLLVNDWTASLLDDLRPLSVWNLSGHCCMI